MALLKNVLPGAASKNAGNETSGHSVLQSNRPSSPSFGKSADRSNVFFPQDGVSVFASKGRRWLAQQYPVTVQAILRMRTPFKILKFIIVTDSILMIDLWFSRGVRQKSLGHQTMRPAKFEVAFLAQQQLQVTIPWN